jgi:DNA mismatch repair protein MutS
MEKLTPMMKQYFNIKKDYEDTLLFYRLGDFYELFFDDAKIVSKECDLVLTSRSKEIEKSPMCGVPHHSVTPYLQKLLNRGYKIAIVEQTEDPSQAKGIVQREVVRIITPGTMIDEMNDEKSSATIASIEDAHYGMALAIVDVSSGKNKVLWHETSTSKLIPLLMKHNVKEIVISKTLSSHLQQAMQQFDTFTITYCEPTTIEQSYEAIIDTKFNETTQHAIRRLIHYLHTTQLSFLSNLKPFVLAKNDEICELDYTTIYNLDLVFPSKNNKNQMTLWSYLDQCKTAMGSRLLKQWVMEPLQNQEAIMDRQGKITHLVKSFLLLDDLRKTLDNVYDLERITTKIAFARATPNDLMQLKKTLKASKDIQSLLENDETFSLWKTTNVLTTLFDKLEKALNEQPPASIKDGGIFKDKYDDTLDHYKKIHRHGKEWLVQFEQQEKDKTSIKNLKVGFNRVFGYYIEISKGNLNLIKDEYGYIRKQTLVNAERFISEQLKEKEDELIHAKERTNSLEEGLFVELLSELQQHIGALQSLADELSILDDLCSLAKISAQKGYVAPTFNKQREVSIKNSVHPLLEKINEKQKVIANDWFADEHSSVFVLTGPNMGGKSTYMRQIALIIILAQMGCYVPAKEASLPIFDAIFTRIGASDDILSGQSTFMVEMVEANTALSLATENSLILFDEIGRGTSTYDGMAIAQAIIEYIQTIIKAKTIFSTHYHELTALEEKLESVQNLVTQVIEKDGEVTFLYRIKKGKADKSYGINVANIAQLPSAVIDRAKGILHELENTKQHVQQSMDIVQVKVIPKHLEKIQNQLLQLDANKMTPIQSIQCLSDLIDQAKKVK